MGKKSRDKGNRIERELVHILQNAGFAAERVPLSGAAGGKFCGDITIPLLGRDIRAEVKCRAHGFAMLYDWLEGAELLIVRADRKKPLVVLSLDFASQIALLAEHQRCGIEKGSA